LFIGCSDRTQPVTNTPTDFAAKVANHTDEPEDHEELPKTIRLTPKVIKDAGIHTAAVVNEALPLTVNLTGQVVADPDRSAKIAARVPGRIAEVHFKEGERVKKGALLAVLESGELARARATLGAAQAKARSARLNADRLANVAKKGLASGQEVANANAEAEAIEAEARAARQALVAFGVDEGSGARIDLRAPVGGFVLSRDATLGQSVGAEHVITTIADLDRAYFVARVFEKDLARVRTGAAAEVRLNAYPNDVFEGVVETVGRQLDETARTVLARIAVKNQRDLLKVGLFGTALVVVPDVGGRTSRAVVPLSAITKIVDKDVVFIHEPDGDFEVHKVALGRSAAGRVEILSGVRVGEQVVVDGVFTLKSAVLKGTFGEEE
jgi:cobalt-zinc-cadmium efflux system membrane fusion protein